MVPAFGWRGLDAPLAKGSSICFASVHLQITLDRSLWGQSWHQETQTSISSLLGLGNGCGAWGDAALTEEAGLSL